MAKDQDINIFAIINPLPESLKKRAEYVESLVWERIRSRPPGRSWVPVRSIQLVAITYLMITYFYDATARAEAAVRSVNRLDAPGFVTVGDAVFTEGNDETLRGRRYADELLRLIGDSQLVGIIEDALCRSLDVESLVEQLIRRTS